MAPPIVLFALQAPTLLNRLAWSPLWRLRVIDWGDTAPLGELAQLAPDIRPYDEREGKPHAVVVCTPGHLVEATRAKGRWGGGVPIVWAAHNGYEPHVTASWEGPLLTFSTNNLATHRPLSAPHSYVIRPQSWRRRLEVSSRPLPLFAMQNRPMSRLGAGALARRQWQDVAARAGREARLYGQGQNWGPLNASEKEHWFACSKGYLSVLPTNAGFGLAEHEALEEGCPLYGLRWGDAHVTLAGYPGLCASEEELVRKLREGREGLDPDVAERWRQAGYALLSTHYTKNIMNDGIQAFLDGLRDAR